MNKLLPTNIKSNEFEDTFGSGGAAGEEGKLKSIKVVTKKSNFILNNIGTNIKDKVRAERCYVTLVEKSKPSNEFMDVDTGNFHERGLSIVRSLNIEPSSLKPR